MVIEFLFASGVLLWVVAVVLIVAWLIGLAAGGKRMSWKRLVVAVLFLGVGGWMLLALAFAASGAEHI